MSDQKHSPLPWVHVAGPNIRDAQGNFVLREFAPENDNARADNYLIVRAVNSHAPMLAALRKIAENAKAAASGDAEEWAMELHDIERDALAAIKQAEAQ